MPSRLELALREQELLGGVVADGLQQAIAGAPGRLVALHEALGGQRGDVVDHVRDADRLAAAHCLGGIHVEAPGEHGAPSQRALLGRREEVVRPVDQRPERPLARQRGASAASEQPEALVESVSQLVERQRARPRRDELERQRDAVEPPADVGDRGRVDRVDRRIEAAARECDRRGVGPIRTRPTRAGSRSPGSGTVSDRSQYTDSPSTPSGSRLVARTVTPGARAEQSVHQRRAGVEQMLAVVEHEHDVAVVRAP